MRTAVSGHSRIPSGRWRALGAGVAVGGVLGGFIAFALILQIDHTATAVHMSTAQDAVGTVAVVTGLAGIGGGLVCGARWWRRPAAQITATGIMVWNWRPLLVPWPVIRAVTVCQPDTGSRVPGLLLASGEVLPLRYAPGVPEELLLRAGGPDAAQTAVMRTIRAALRARQPEPPDGAAAAFPQSRGPVRGRLARRQLPGTPLRDLPRGHLPRQWLTVPVAPLPFALWWLVRAQSGHPFNDAQFFLGAGAIAGVLALAALIQWLCWTRRVVIGGEWLAWQPRLLRAWRVLPFSQVVSVAPGAGAGGRRVTLRRGDGRGIDFAEAQLVAGAAVALLPALAGNPGLTAGARSMLAAAAARDVTAAPPGWQAGAPGSRDRTARL